MGFDHKSLCLIMGVAEFLFVTKYKAITLMPNSEKFRRTRDDHMPPLDQIPRIQRNQDVKPFLTLVKDEP